MGRCMAQASPMGKYTVQASPVGKYMLHASATGKYNTQFRRSRLDYDGFYKATLRTQFLSLIVDILALFHMDFASTAITLAREDLEVVGSSIRRQRY